MAKYKEITAHKTRSSQERFNRSNVLQHLCILEITCLSPDDPGWVAISLQMEEIHAEAATCLSCRVLERAGVGRVYKSEPAG